MAPIANESIASPPSAFGSICRGSKLLNAVPQEAGWPADMKKNLHRRNIVRILGFLRERLWSSYRLILKHCLLFTGCWSSVSCSRSASTALPCTKCSGVCMVLIARSELMSLTFFFVLRRELFLSPKLWIVLRLFFFSCSYSFCIPQPFSLSRVIQWCPAKEILVEK